MVDSPDFVPKLSNVERGQRLDGWPADTLQFNIIYLAAARREELSGGRQKSYLAAASKEELSGGRQKSYIWGTPEELFRGRQKIRVISRLPEELFGGRQKSYEGRSKITESFLI